MTATIERVVLVGHCGADEAMLRRTVQSVLGDIPVSRANDQQALDAALTGHSLLLINRVLDGWFDTGSGVEMIRQLRQRAEGPRLVLVSNYPEAQQQAQAAGAWPGFGKGDQTGEEAARRLREAAGLNTSDEPEPNRPG